MTKFSTMSSIHCDYFPACSGCERQHEVTSPPIYQEIKKFFNRDVSLFHGDLIHWRTRSKLAVRNTHKEIGIGLFKRSTHEVVSIPRCPLHHPSICHAYDLIVESMRSIFMAPYDEKTGKGILRYLQFGVERKSRKVQLVLVVNEHRKTPLIEAFVHDLHRNAIFSSIWLNYQPTSTNCIFGNQWELCSDGDGYAWEEIGAVLIPFHPACFVQAHLPMFERVLTSIRQSIIKNRRVVEFYAGVGAIGLNVADLSASVVCSEINPYAESCFQLALQGIEHRDRVSFVRGAAEHFTPLLNEAEVLIVDPPRKGLEPHFLSQVIASVSLDQIIYVSCYFPSFKRDCEALFNAGWEIQKAETYLFFPGTNHLEILCVLKRKNSDKGWPIQP